MCTPCAPPCVSMHRPCVSLNFHPGMPPCDLPCVPHAFPPCAHPFLCVILRVLPMSSSASSRVPHRVSPCTFHVSPQFPSWHATVRSSVRPAVRLSVRPSVFPVMCPTVRPSVCPSVRPVCVLLRVLLVSSNVSSCVPYCVSPCTIHVSPPISIRLCFSTRRPCVHPPMSIRAWGRVTIRASPMRSPMSPPRSSV